MGQADGADDGDDNGDANKTDLERALGLEFHVVNGIVEACPPGQRPAPRPTAEEHAAALLDWLMGQPPFSGTEVPAELLATKLYPFMCDVLGWEPYAWQKVAGHFKQMPGVKRRQLDRRTGPSYGEKSPVLYAIPDPNR